MGIVSGFLAGAGNAATDVGKMYLMNQLQSERDEATYLRNKELKKGTQEFATSEREAGEVFKAKEGVLDRDAKTAQAIAKTGVAGMSLADRQKAANRTISEVKAGNVEYQSMTSDQIADLENEIYFDYGLNPTGEKIIEKSMVPAAAPSQADIEPSTADIQQANKWYDENASIWSSDKSQFGGMSEKQVKAKRAKEIAMERTGKKGGIIASQTGGNALPSTKTAPQAALDHVKNNPKLLPDFIKKYGYDPTK